MSRYRFDLATPADDAQLRGILAATPMPGNVSLCLRREPSYFAAASVDGRFRQVIAARDCSTGLVVGFGSRSISQRYVGGRPQAVGYLSTLRLLRDHRNVGLVARGYRYFRTLDEDARAAFYLTTISATNAPARQLLTSHRAGLPYYHAWGEYHTLAIPLAPRRPRTIPDGLSVRQARAEDRERIIAFLASHGPRRQFFPCYQSDDLFAADSLLAGLRAEDLWLALAGDEIIGTLGLWDQSAFRQAIVHSYRGWLRWSLPLVNAAARVGRWPKLPPPGEPMSCLLAAVPVIASDDPAVLRSLLSVALAAAHGKGDYLLFGAHSDDPLLPVVRRHARTSYTTCLYLVSWQPELPAELRSRVPYLELGSL